MGHVLIIIFLFVPSIYNSLFVKDETGDSATKQSNCITKMGFSLARRSKYDATADDNFSMNSEQSSISRDQVGITANERSSSDSNSDNSSSSFRKAKAAQTAATSVSGDNGILYVSIWRIITIFIIVTSGCVFIYFTRMSQQSLQRKEVRYMMNYSFCDM